MSSENVLILLIFTGLFWSVFIMSDNFNKLDGLKLNNDLRFGTSLSPNLKKNFLENGKVILTITISNTCVKEIQFAHDKSELTFIDIINSQIQCFQLYFSKRLEERLCTKARKVNKALKTKYRSGRKRYDYLSDMTSIAIYEHEVYNVKELSCSLESFKTENFELEKKCSSMLRDFEQLQNDLFECSLECSNLHITENSLKKKCELFSKTELDLVGKNEELQTTLRVQTDTVTDMKQEQVTLKKQTLELQSTNKELQQYVKKLEQSLPLARKNYDSVQSRNRSRQLRTLANEAQKALWFSESFGLTPKSIHFSSTQGKDVNVHLNQTDYRSLDGDDKVKLRQLIYILDKFSVSDAAYHELSMIDENLPRKYLIVQERSNLNSIFHIQRTPGEKPGAYVSIESEIASYIRTNNLQNDLPIKVKLAGDGAKVSRISNFVTFTLSFPDISNCASINNIRTVAVLKCKEAYDDLCICASPVFIEYNSLVNKPEIVVDGSTFSLDLYFNGDMKFIQLCMGLSGSTANYACPWCFVSKDDRTDTSKECSYYESTEMKRTLDQLHSNAEKKTLGSKYKPLVEIELSKIVPDELHLFLRISDVLLQNVMDDCRQQDSKALVLKKNADHVERLVKAINDCGVTFHTWIDAAGSPQFTSLTGSDYKKLFKTLPEKLLFIVNNDTFDDTVFLLREIGSIQEMVSQKSSSDVNKLDIFGKVKLWVDRFLSLHRKGRIGYNRVTPYMHALIYHVPAFWELHSGIGQFSGQGVEKINDEVKLIHQKRSNKSNQTVDDLTTRKRMEFLIDQKCERNKRPYSKVNEEYWSTVKSEKQKHKKRRIDFDILSAHERFEKENEKPIEDMSIEELKQKLKKLGIVTKVRKHEKLVRMLLDEMKKLP